MQKRKIDKKHYVETFLLKERKSRPFVNRIFRTAFTNIQQERVKDGYNMRLAC